MPIYCLAACVYVKIMIKGKEKGKIYYLEVTKILIRVLLIYLIEHRLQ